ncbi:MAG: LptF/LptG family permease [Armatimonadota bacterium]
MKYLDKLIWRELLGPFFFGVTAFTGVFFSGTYLLKLTTWVMNGMPLATAVTIVALYLPGIVVITLPMATLLAVLLGIGRLSSDSEVVALFAGGISLYRIVVPVFLLGLFVSTGSILLNEVIAPQANIRNQELQAAVFKQAALSDSPFSLTDEGTKSLIRVSGGMDSKSGVLKDVTILQNDSQGRPSVIIYADHAEWVGVDNNPENRYKWRLYDGYLQIGLGTDNPAFWKFQKSQTREIKIEKTPGQFALYQKNTEQMSFAELSQMVKYLRAHPDRPLDKISQLDVDRWNKLALPISSLVFALLAAPLAIRPSRSGSSVGFGLSILLILIYWIIWRYTSSLAIQGDLAPIAGAFIADVLGIVAGVVLLKRAAK